MTNTKPRVFVSYSHKDTRWKDQLLDHLRVYELEDLLVVWEDRQIRAGQDWLSAIEKAIQEAQVAILLISRHFLASEFIHGKEVPPILERRSKQGLIVVPVIVGSCNWKDISWLKGIQARPREKTLYSLKGDPREAAMAEIAKEIRNLLREEGRPEGPSLPSLDPWLAKFGSAVHQLPALPLDFVGRSTEISELKEAIREGESKVTTLILGICGLGGVGKTTLALKLAHEIAPIYPDGQIFLDLLGMSTPLSTAQAMAHVIFAFHPRSPLPASEAELAPLYRSVLYGKRVLLLMDNAASGSQVEPLIPPEGSALLLTSRIRFALPGLVGRDLNELPREKSRELLLKIGPRIGGYADEMPRACGDLPLALRMAASTLQERRSLSPEAYLQRLASGHERLMAVDKALSLSSELLPEQLRRFWYQLGIFSKAFDPKAAAAVWEIDFETAEPNLAELERSSLVEWNEIERRYHLHDLVRSFVNSRLSGSDQEATGERHAKHFLKILSLADELYLNGGEDLIRGLKLFDLEWSNIQAGQAFAAAEATRSEEAARLCCAYPDAGTYCLGIRQTAGEQIQWRKAALDAARRLKDRMAEGRHLCNMGLSYSDLGHAQRAIEAYEYCLIISRETYDRYLEGRILGNLGNTYAELGRTRKAIEFYMQHLVIAREIGDRRGESATLGNLGVAYKDLGENGRAIATFEEALLLSRETDDRSGEALAYWNLGLLYEHDNPARAVELMQVRVAYEREIKHLDAEVRAAYVKEIRARIGNVSA